MLLGSDDKLTLFYYSKQGEREWRVSEHKKVESVHVLSRNIEQLNLSFYNVAQIYLWCEMKIDNNLQIRLDVARTDVNWGSCKRVSW
jgi:hypothetical protein